MDSIKNSSRDCLTAKIIMVGGQSPLQAVPSSVSDIEDKSQGLDWRRLEPDIDWVRRTGIDGQLYSVIILFINRGKYWLFLLPDTTSCQTKKSWITCFTNRGEVLNHEYGVQDVAIHDAGDINDFLDDDSDTDSDIMSNTNWDTKSDIIREFKVTLKETFTVTIRVIQRLTLWVPLLIVTLLQWLRVNLIVILWELLRVNKSDSELLRVTKGD